uniref:Uncharacterized protein n=1 Tax=Neobodo designis TaxID=312471 RepID=A0A7S1W9N2_NEODS
MTALPCELFFEVGADILATYLRSNSLPPEELRAALKNCSAQVLTACGGDSSTQLAVARGSHQLLHAAARCFFASCLAVGESVGKSAAVMRGASNACAFAEALCRTTATEALTVKCGNGVAAASTACIVTAVSKQRAALVSHVGMLEALECHLRCTLRAASALSNDDRIELIVATSSLLRDQGGHSEIDHTGVNSAALRLLCRCVSICGSASQITIALDAVRRFAVAHQPLSCRYAAALALQEVARRPELQENCDARLHALCRTFELCFDDDSFVRSAANRCAESICGATELQWSPTECLRALTTSMTNLMQVQGASQVVEATEHTLCADAVEAEDSDGEGEDDDCALFEAEGDNMFVESVVVKRWLAPVHEASK